MQQHLLGTGDRLLAEASPYDTIWGLGYRADHKNALCPPAWRGLNLLGKALQIVLQRLRDRAPPPVRHLGKSSADCAPAPPRPRSAAGAPSLYFSPAKRFARAK